MKYLYIYFELSTFYIISEALYDAYTDLYLYEHSVMITIYIWEDDRPTISSWLLVLGEAEKVHTLHRQPDYDHVL